MIENQTSGLHWLLIAVWLLIPLFCGFLDLDQQRLIAHDEGLYATRAREMLMQQDWIHPWAIPHHKTPGSYWILAGMFQLFGINEITARFPSILASVACGVLVYEIAKDLLSTRIALWSVFTLSTSFLWVQYGRFATPDIVFIALFLAGLLCLLRAEKSQRYGDHLRFIAGMSWGLACLVRSFLLMLPMAGLMPYLLVENRRHRHLYNPWLYVGMGVGLLPTLLWLWACWQRYGAQIFQAVMDFPVRKATRGGDRFLSGIVFYLTSLGMNSFPWGLFTLMGWGGLLKRPANRQQIWLLGVYPLVIFGLLSLSSTHLHHYALVIYPFLAMLAGIAMDGICESASRWSRRGAIAIALFLGLLGIILVMASGFLYSPLSQQNESLQSARLYVPIALTLGIAWVITTALKLTSVNWTQWLLGLLLANWLTLMVAGFSGVLGNGDLSLKAFLLEPEVQTVLDQHVINFTPLQGKLSVLIRFYTPRYGSRLSSVSELPTSGYAWVWEDNLGDIAVPYTLVGNFKQVFLIKLGS